MQQKQVYVVEHSSDEPNMVFEDLETLGSTVTKMFGTFSEVSKTILRRAAENVNPLPIGGAALRCIRQDGSSVILTVFPATLNLKK